MPRGYLSEVLSVECGICHKIFTYKNYSHRLPRKFCSRECSNQVGMGGRQKTEPPHHAVCIHCQKTFTYAYTGKEGKARKFCGHACFGLSKRGLKYTEGTKIPKEPRTLEDRFWEKINKTETGCWLWTGQKTAKGFGRVWVGMGKGFHQYAHRVVFQLLGKEVPSLWRGTQCENRLCVNPEHLIVSLENPLKREWKRDLTGLKFGSLTVVKRIENPNGPVKWRATCDCGKPVEILGKSLLRKKENRCYCPKSEEEKLIHQRKENFADKRLRKIMRIANRREREVKESQPFGEIEALETDDLDVSTILKDL